MKLELNFEREADGSFTVLLNGQDDAGKHVSVRSLGNPTAEDVAWQVVRLFTRRLELPESPQYEYTPVDPSSWVGDPPGLEGSEEKGVPLNIRERQ